MHATFLFSFLFSLLKLFKNMFLTINTNSYLYNVHLPLYHTTIYLAYAQTISQKNCATLYNYDIAQHNIQLYKINTIHAYVTYIIHNIIQILNLFCCFQKFHTRLAKTGYVMCLYIIFLNTRKYATMFCNILTIVSKHIIKNYPIRNVSIRISLNKIQ